MLTGCMLDLNMEQPAAHKAGISLCGFMADSCQSVIAYAHYLLGDK